MGDNLIAEGKVRIICDLLGLKSGLDESKKLTADAMGAMGSGMVRVMTIAAAAAAAAGSALVVLVHRATETGTKFHDLSMQIGMSTEELSRLSYAAATADLTAEDMAQAVGFLSKQIVATGSAAFVGATGLGRLGISVRDANGEMRSTHEVLLDVARAFQKLPDGPQKTQLAMELFGRAGKQMIPLLNDGADSIEKLEARADELGITVSQRFSKEADEFGDQLSLMKMRVQNVGRSIAEDMLPALNNVTHLLAGDFAEHSRGAQMEMGGFSTLMRGLSADFDEFASKMEATNKKTDYWEFLFKRWAADIDAASTGLKYFGSTVAAVGGSIPILMGDPKDAGFAPGQMPGLDIPAGTPKAGGFKRGWDDLKDWWRGWWSDMGRINEEGARALEDLDNRYFGVTDEQLAAQLARMRLQSEEQAKGERQLQLDILHRREELAQLGVQRVTAAVDATGMSEAQKVKRIEVARDQVRLFADSLAIVARDEAFATTGNKALADAMYTYTKRVLEATFANEDQARSIAEVRHQLELQLQEMQHQHTMREEMQRATLEGFRAEAAAIKEKADYERQVAEKSILNEKERATKIRQITEEEENAKEALRIREAREVERLNQETMVSTMSMTLRGYALERMQLDESFRLKEDQARRTISNAEHLAARLIAIEEEKYAALQQLNDKWTHDVVRAMQVVNADWQAQGLQLVEVVRAEFTSMRDTVSTVFFDILTHKISSIDDAFKGLWHSVLKGLTDMLADQVIKMLLAFLTKLIMRIMAARAAAGMSASTGASDLLSAGAGTMVAAIGAVFAGGFTPIRAFAGGGIATRPTLGLVGEAGMNEAMVPLPDGRNIPVKLADSQRPMHIALTLAWAQDLIQSFKTTPDEISLVINRQMMMNGPLRQNFQVRG